MSRGDAKTAVMVLKAMGVMERPIVGPADAEEVQRVQELEERKRAVEKKEAEWEVRRMEDIGVL